MRPRLPEKSEEYPVDYYKVISTMGDGLSKIVTMKEPLRIYEQILRDIQELFGLTEIALKMNVEGSLRIAFKAVHGYDASLAAKMLRHEYPEDWIEREIREDYRVSRNGYLIDGEQYGRFIVENPQYDPSELYDHPEKLLASRGSPEEWHEADFFEFVIHDGAGNIVGYLEVNESLTNPDRLPSLEVVKAVDVFSQLIGIANRILTQLEEEKKKREATSLLSSALSRSLAPLLGSAGGMISKSRRLSSDPEQAQDRLAQIIHLLRRSIGILDSVTLMADIESRSPSLLTINSLDRLVQQWKTRMSIERRELKVDLKAKGTGFLTKVDVRFPDLLTATLSFLETASGLDIEQIGLELFKEGGDDNWLRLRVSSKDIDLKGWKSIGAVIQSSSRGHKDYHTGYLPLYVMNQIVRDYAGGLELDLGDDTGSLMLKLPHHWVRTKTG